ncbi:hypothetical protein Tco_0724209 [Tanacetum coccineum]
MNWGEVNPTHAYYNVSCTIKDTGDPSWSTSFKTRRTQKTSSALEDFICVVFVPDRNIVTSVSYCVHAPSMPPLSSLLLSMAMIRWLRDDGDDERCLNLHPLGCNLAKSLSIYVLPRQSTNFTTISNASAFPTLDANAGDDELVGVIDQFCFAYTIGPTDAELKEDRLKDDRVHGGYDMEEKATRANFMTLKDCLGLLLSRVDKHRSFTVNLKHDEIFLPHPFSYINGDEKQITDLNFEGILYADLRELVRKLVRSLIFSLYYRKVGKTLAQGLCNLKNDADVQEFLKVGYESKWVVDLYTKHFVYDAMDYKNSNGIDYESSDSSDAYCSSDEEYDHLEQLKLALANYGVASGYQLWYEKNDWRQLLVFCGRDVTTGTSRDGEGSSRQCETPLASGKVKEKTVSPKWTKSKISADKQAKGKPICSLVTYKWIAHQFAKEIITDPFITLLKMKVAIREKFLINVSLGQCKRAKQKALFDFEGGLIEHYGRLWEYKHVGVAVADGWKASCKRVIGLDGCILKHTCKGELLTEVGRLYIMQRLVHMNNKSMQLEDRITPSIMKRLEILKEQQRLGTMISSGFQELEVRRDEEEGVLGEAQWVVEVKQVVSEEELAEVGEGGEGVEMVVGEHAELAEVGEGVEGVEMEMTEDEIRDNMKHEYIKQLLIEDEEKRAAKDKARQDEFDQESLKLELEEEAKF